MTNEHLLRQTLKALEHCLREESDLQHALARFLCDESNPLALALNASDCLYLAEHMLSRAQVQKNTLTALVRDDKRALQTYLGDPDSPTGQLRRQRLKHLDFSAAKLPQSALQALFDALKEGATPAQTLYGNGEQLKATLAVLSYLMLRSGLLPEENDNVHADALIAGVCASVDMAAVLATVREKQETFVSTQKLLQCAYLAFLMCACEVAAEDEVPDELARELTHPALLHSALHLAGEQVPRHLYLAAESETLREKLRLRLMPAVVAQRAIEKLQAAEKASPQIAQLLSEPIPHTVYVEEPERPD